jgi:hypothetical protein
MTAFKISVAFSPLANYTDRATAACRRSLRIEGVAWSAQRIPSSVKSRFSRPEPLLFHSSSSSIILTGLSGPRSRPTTSQHSFQHIRTTWLYEMTGRLFEVRLVHLTMTTRFSPAAVVKLYATSRANFFIRRCHLARPVCLSAWHNPLGHMSHHWVRANHSTALNQGKWFSLLESPRCGRARCRCQGSCLTWLVDIRMISDQWSLLVKTNRLLCRERNIRSGVCSHRLVTADWPRSLVARIFVARRAGTSSLILRDPLAALHNPIACPFYAEERRAIHPSDSQRDTPHADRRSVPFLNSLGCPSRFNLVI